jgi:hypothetical protein
MTSRDDDWIDDLLNDEASFVQIGIIEQLLNTSSARDFYTDINLTELTYAEAEEIIRELRENDNPRDPRDQFYKIFGRYGQHKGD